MSNLEGREVQKYPLWQKMIGVHAYKWSRKASPGLLLESRSRGLIWGELEILTPVLARNELNIRDNSETIPQDRKQNRRMGAIIVEMGFQAISVHGAVFMYDLSGETGGVFLGSFLLIRAIYNAASHKSWTGF